MSSTGPYLSNIGLKSLSVVYKLKPNTPRHLDGAGSSYLKITINLTLSAPDII